MKITCAICGHPEKSQTGKAHAITKKETTELICSNCVAMAIGKGLPHLPWSRDEFAKPFMRRRKIPVLNRRSITNESEVTETGSD